MIVTHRPVPERRKVLRLPSNCSFNAIDNNKTFKFMKKSLHVLSMVGKYYLYGFFLQLLCLNLMYASPTKGQSSLNISEVYLSLNLKDASLTESFNKIKSETAFLFIYDQELVDESLPVNLEVEHQSLENVLLSLSASHHLSFKQVDDRISVKETNKSLKINPFW